MLGKRKRGIPAKGRLQDEESLTVGQSSIINSVYMNIVDEERGTSAAIELEEVVP